MDNPTQAILYFTLLMGAVAIIYASAFMLHLFTMTSIRVIKRVWNKFTTKTKTCCNDRLGRSGFDIADWAKKNLKQGLSLSIKVNRNDLDQANIKIEELEKLIAEYKSDLQKSIIREIAKRESTKVYDRHILGKPGLIANHQPIKRNFHTDVIPDSAECTFQVCNDVDMSGRKTGSLTITWKEALEHNLSYKAVTKFDGGSIPYKPQQDGTINFDKYRKEGWTDFEFGKVEFRISKEELDRIMQMPKVSNCKRLIREYANAPFEINDIFHCFVDNYYEENKDRDNCHIIYCDDRVLHVRWE